MKKLAAMSFKARRAAVDMHHSDGKFMKMSEFRSKADAVRELMDEGYVVGAEQHEIAGYRLSRLGQQEVERSLKAGEVYASA